MTMMQGYGNAGNPTPSRRDYEDDDEEGAAYDNSQEMKEERPTLEWVEALAKWAGGTLSTLAYSITPGSSTASSAVFPVASGFFGNFYREVATDERFLRREYVAEVLGDPKAPDFPDGFIIRIPPTASDKARAANAQVFIGDPQITVEIPDGFRSAEKRADLERLFTKACYGWHNTEERESDTSPLNDIKNNCISLGLAVRTTVLNKSKYPEKPERKPGERKNKWEERKKKWDRERRKAGSSVFATRSVHPLNVAYDRQNTPPTWVLIREPIEGSVAAKEYPSWKSGEGYKLPSADAPLMTMARLWTNCWTGCWINGEPALGEKEDADVDGIAENPYGFIPVWFAAGGHGKQDVAGRPEFELQGIIRGARDLLIEEAVIYNLKGVYLRRASYGPKDVIIGPDTDPRTIERIRRELLGGPNVVAHMPLNYQHSTVNPSPIPDSVMQMDQKNDLYINRATIDDVSTGFSGNAEPAARTRVRLQQVEKTLADAALHVEQSLEADYTARFAMIKNVLKCPVGVNVPQKGQPAEYVEIDPDDIPDGLIVKVNLVGESEEEKARKQEQADARLGTSLDLKGYYEMIGERDPEARIQGLHEDQMRQAITMFMVQLAQGLGPQILAQVAQAKGIQFTPEELATAAMRAGVADAVQGAPMAGGGQPPQAQQGGQQPIEVNQQGAALPGTPYENAESGVSDNPQIARPDSGEALQQRLRLSART
jgi:hypothetical protein